MAIEDIITDPDQVPTSELSMTNSYCRLGPITCGVVAADVPTDFYKTAEAEEWGNVSTLPWMTT